MDLNFDSLDAFVVFSETRNFTHAAEILHISQPALHVKIRKLSEELGVELYTKSGRELILTKYGTELARFGRETRNHVSGFVEQLIQGKNTQPVTLAAGSGAYLYLLGDALRRFKRKAKVSLKLLTADRKNTLELIASGQAQLGVTVLDSIPDSINTQLLVTVPTALVVQQDHRLARRKSVSVLELNETELIVPSIEKPHRATISRILEQHGISWDVAIETSGWELTIHFVKLGLGAAIVNACCKIPKGLKAIPLKEFPNTNYYLVSKRNIQFTDNQQMLSDLITEYTTG